jgi:hypothetical protein
MAKKSTLKKHVRSTETFLQSFGMGCAIWKNGEGVSLPLQKVKMKTALMGVAYVPSTVRVLAVSYWRSQNVATCTALFALLKAVTVKIYLSMSFANT